MAQKIALISLSFSYFKGLISFNLEANGQDLDVYGDNAAGKTTLFDGFSWLLFDKDSRDKAQPEKWIKTLDASGEPLHGIEHEVEGVMLINGRHRTLKKVFAEKWTKKRGSTTPDFTGHSTDYYIDGAPLKKSDYEAEIASFIDEDKFKLLTNPTYFNEVYDKNKRRKLLLEVCGDLSDEDVIANNPDLSVLPAIMEGRTLDRHRDKIKSEQKRINDELKDIPTRISEVQRTMPVIAGADEKTVITQLEALRGRIAGKEEELSRIQSGGEIAVKEKCKREIEGEILQLKNTIQSRSLDKVNAQRQGVSKTQGRLSDIEAELNKASRQQSTNSQIIAEKNAERDRLRDQWREFDAQVYEIAHIDENCPACGQALPGDQVEDAHRKASDNFNRSKSDKLESISKSGKAAAAEVERLTVENEKLTSKIHQINNDMSAVTSEISTMKTVLEKLEAGIQDVDTNQDYIAKQQEIAVVDREIVGLRSASIGAIEAARIELAKLRTEADQLQQNKATFELSVKGKERIETLKGQEKVLAKQYEELEKQLHLTDEFIRTKVSLLESKINSKFRNVRFKLFNTLVNGAVEETCETLYGPNQVPYSGGLNRAAQLNSGLDIIETLSQHYGITAPIFIDNAEAVTELAKTSGQQLRLIVSKPDKQLRVEKAAASNDIFVDNEVL